MSNSKHALITGSSRSIGRAVALKLAEHGVKGAIDVSCQQAQTALRLVRV